MSEHVRVWATKEVWDLVSQPDDQLLIAPEDALTEEVDGEEVLIEPAHKGMLWGSGAAENPLPEGGDPATHDYGRIYTEQAFEEHELEVLAACTFNGSPAFHIVRPHGFGGAEWGPEEWEKENEI